jgi:RNA polymerase sigma-70 factor (ECF subfamily)
VEALHAQARSTVETDWTQIVALYDLLARVDPGPVVSLNRAVATSARDGAEAGLAAIDAAFARGGLDDYPLAHAARADMQRKLGLREDALASYRRALALAHQPAERRFLEGRVASLVER